MKIRAKTEEINRNLKKTETDVRSYTIIFITVRFGYKPSVCEGGKIQYDGDVTKQIPKILSTGILNH